jgi:hypothetical protein
MSRPGIRAVLIVALTLCALVPGRFGIAHAEELRYGGKLLLTNGVTTVEGASGGGLAPWATIAGNETRDGIGLSGHATLVAVKSYDYQSAGVSVGLFDRVEMSWAREHFDTNKIGGALGLGDNYAFNQDVFGAKVKLFGDLVYDRPLVPAIAVGVQYKKNHNGSVVRLLGARHDEGVDYYVSATKLFLSKSLLINATARLTKANQLGLLGFGGDARAGYGVQLEGSAAYQLSRRLAVGAEYRSKPDNLRVAREDGWYDAFAAYAVNRHLTVTLAYTDLGSIATVKNQRGLFASLQAAF